MRVGRGFTIVELAVTVVVVAILVGAAVPNLRGLLQNNRMGGQANQLFTSLNMARSEALKQQVNVYVTANSGGFSAGWKIWADVNSNDIQDATEAEFAIVDALQGGSTVTVVPTAASMFFKSDGTADATRAFQMRIPNCRGENARDVSVSSVGRVSVTRVNC